MEQNSLTPQAENLKARWLVRATVAVGGVVALGLLSSFILAAAVAGAGLAVLGVLALGGVGLFQALPYIGQRWENKLLALRKEEARRNPIETLQNYLMLRDKQVKQFKDAVTSIGAQIQSLADMLEDRKKLKPNADYSRQERSLAAMRQAHDVLESKYRNADNALTQLSEVIEDKKFEYSFGQLGQQAIQNMNMSNGEDLLNNMLADEAFSSVRNNFNKVFSELELEAGKLTAAKQLSFDEGMTIDVSSIQLEDLVTVKQGGL